MNENTMVILQIERKKAIDNIDDLLSVPVVDHGRVIGIVTVDDIMDAIVQETTEDLQKLVNVKVEARAHCANTYGTAIQNNRQ